MINAVKYIHAYLVAVSSLSVLLLDGYSVSFKTIYEILKK